VAQGFVLAVFLYGMAYIKAGGLQWFAFSLLGILVGFSGIYTSYLENGFNPDYLASYLIAYSFGAAIVIAVSSVVVPMSSEKELRTMLVTSLQHTATFADLIVKTFSLEISEGESVACLRGNLKL
jgi:hypothetical protein